MTKDMTSGSPARLILRFTIPLIFGNLFQQFYSMVDTIIVGRFLGTEALAAVGSTGSINFLIIGFCLGLCSGFAIPVSQQFGAKNFAEMKKYIGNTIWLTIWSSVLFTVATVLLCRPMLEWMATPEDVLDQAVLYMRIYFIGMPATMLYNFGAAVLRAVGDTRRPLYFLMMSGAVNVICNLFFVIVLDLGVVGVASATVIAQIISACLIVYCLTQMDGPCHVDLKHMHFHLDKFRRMMQIGLPAGLQSVIFNISNVLIQSSINSFGAIVVAGNTAAANIEGFVYTSMNAIYQTALSFTSQNLGARQYGRIDQILIRCLILVACIGLLLGNGAHFFGRELLSIYSGEAEVVSYGMARLNVVAVTYFLCGMMDVVAGSVRGMGYSVMPMLVSLAGACVFRIFWIFTIFRWQHTLFVLYISYPISWILTVCAQVVCYLVLRRKVFRPVQKQTNVPSVS